MNYKIISELPQEDDISSISQQESGNYEEGESHFKIDNADEDESFDMGYHDLKSKGLKIMPKKPPVAKPVKDKENLPPHVEVTSIRRPQSATVPQKSILKNKSILPPQPVVTEASPRPDFRPVYSGSINSFLQKKKQYNYTQKNFNTLVKKSDRVARFQEMSQVWKKSTYLKNSFKEGRKLNLEDRIKYQKEQQRSEGIFHRYVSKSELFI